jgi:alpha-beta hydrolase superfamily lysophospholipase
MWKPDGEPTAVVQIVHGMCEHIGRYDGFARALCERGWLVVGIDHVGHGRTTPDPPERGVFDHKTGADTMIEDQHFLRMLLSGKVHDIPYIIFGHSMGSFMARTMLCKYPDSGISAAIICGTGWQPSFALPALIKVLEGICKKNGEETPNQKIHDLVFGGYNKRIPNPRTTKDWLSRDEEIVDRYVADPLCGFVASCGLMRDMIIGIRYVQTPANLANMKKYLPVLFIAGDADPVGPYGKGVEKAAKAFRKSGMVNVTVKLYPEARHEILNEINYREVFEDIREWLDKTVG